MKRKDFISLLKELHITMWKEVEKKDIDKRTTKTISFIRSLLDGSSRNITINFNNIVGKLTKKQLWALNTALSFDCFICGYGEYKRIISSTLHVNETKCDYCNVFPEFVVDDDNAKCEVNGTIYSKWYNAQTKRTRVKYARLIQDCFPEN